MLLTRSRKIKLPRKKLEMHKLFNHIPFRAKLFLSFLYISIVMLLSLLPAQDLPKVPLFPYADKLIHIGMYFNLAIILLWTFHSKPTKRITLYAFILLWGLVMEILQILMRSGRHFSWLDILANATGLGLGILLYNYLINRFKLHKEASSS